MLPVKNFDQTFCGNLPLHLTNLIQSHGALLVIDASTLHIIQASENIYEFLGTQAKDVVGRHAAYVFSEEEIAKLAEKITTGKASRVPVNLRIDSSGSFVHLLGLVHPKDQYAILEIERRNDNIDDQDAFLEFYQKLRYLMSAIDSASSAHEACEVMTRELSKLTGYDRVMVYQFDSDWNGTVVSESINTDGLEPYLGLKFPASDVPKPARELYFRNPYRLIPDRNYKPSRLFPVLNPLTGGFTDMSDCNLRSVANVHLEYMGNMEIDASMSIRIIMENRLWGLISCHNKTPKFLDFEMCSVIELLSNVFSSKLNSLYNKEDFSLRTQVQDLLMKLLNQVDSYGLTDGLLNHSTSLLEFFNAPGAAVILNGRVFSAGIVPAQQDIKELVLWLDSMKSNDVFSTLNLSRLNDTWRGISKDASGLLAIPIGAALSTYILGFRPEVVRTIEWGGNPNEAVQFEQGTKNYHPRSSFKQWQQLVQNTSLPWESPVLDISERLRVYLMEYSLRKA